MILIRRIRFFALGKLILRFRKFFSRNNLLKQRKDLLKSSFVEMLFCSGLAIRKVEVVDKLFELYSLDGACLFCFVEVGFLKSMSLYLLQ